MSSLLRLRIGYFLSGLGIGAGFALLQIRADLAHSTHILSTKVTIFLSLCSFFVFFFFENSRIIRLFSSLCIVAFSLLVHSFASCSTRADAALSAEDFSRLREFRETQSALHTHVFVLPPKGSATRERRESKEKTNGVSSFLLFSASLSRRALPNNCLVSLLRTAEGRETRRSPSTREEKSKRAPETPRVGPGAPRSSHSLSLFQLPLCFRCFFSFFSILFSFLLALLALLFCLFLSCFCSARMESEHFRSS